jgi:hypothetical protein
MLGRVFFLIFFCLGGFLFYIPKWILMGTKSSRQINQLSKQYQAKSPRDMEKERRLEEEMVRLGNWRPRP